MDYSVREFKTYDGTEIKLYKITDVESKYNKIAYLDNHDNEYDVWTMSSSKYGWCISMFFKNEHSDIKNKLESWEYTKEEYTD